MSENEKKVPRRNLGREIDILKACIAKMAHFSGSEKIILEYKLERWVPGKNDMKKYKD